MLAVRQSHERVNASPAMNTTLPGSKTKSRHVLAKAGDSIRDTEVESNEIDESDRQHKKHDAKRIAILLGIVTLSSQPKY
jgi:hypothetical protein